MLTSKSSIMISLTTYKQCQTQKIMKIQKITEMQQNIFKSIQHFHNFNWEIGRNETKAWMQQLVASIISSNVLCYILLCGCKPTIKLEAITRFTNYASNLLVV